MKCRLMIIVFTILFFSCYSLNAQNYDNIKEHACLKCHANQTITFYNDLMEREEKGLMNPYYIIDTVGLRTGVHNVFDCIDCHSYEYTDYPHPANVKLEPLPTCLDCHGGDETFATYQFEKIQEEFQKSVHYEVYNDNFTCAKCHDQHTYRPIARTSDNVEEIVAYDNGMCLTCHNNMVQFKLMSGRENPELVRIHEWLPNQELHFKQVRCLECHTEVIDGLMVSHHILKKENAVRNCVECHSANSRLKASLYKYQNLQKQTEEGGLKSVISNESYVIGSQQIPILKTLSIIIFSLTLALIIVHGIFRWLKK